MYSNFKYILTILCIVTVFGFYAKNLNLYSQENLHKIKYLDKLIDETNVDLNQYKNLDVSILLKNIFNNSKKERTKEDEEIINKRPNIYENKDDGRIIHEKEDNYVMKENTNQDNDNTENNDIYLINNNLKTANKNGENDVELVNKNTYYLENGNDVTKEKVKYGGVKQKIKKHYMKNRKKSPNEFNQTSPILHLVKDEYWPIYLKPSSGRFFDDLDLSNYNAEELEILNNGIPIYKERANTIAKVCSTLPKMFQKPYKIHELVWDSKHSPNLVWCEISKVGSTTWMVNFLRLGHYKENDTEILKLPKEQRDAVRFQTMPNFNTHYEVFKLFPAPKTTKQRNIQFKKSLRFIIVRHPFTMIVSGFRDKMLKLNPRPQIWNYRQLQLDIIQRYRPEDSPEKSEHPTFSEFVDYVLDSTDKELWKKAGFMKPYWATCGVCSHDYQLIMKLETFQQDNQFLATLADLKEIKEVSEWRGKIDNTTSFDKSMKFYSTLTKLQIIKLYKRYEYDFQLFDYSPDEYIKIAI